jgi:hypothetical protein
MHQIKHNVNFHLKYENIKSRDGTSSSIGTLCAPSEHSFSLNKLPVQHPMFSKVKSLSDNMTLEALYISNRVFVSHKYPCSELWKLEASAI